MPSDPHSTGANAFADLLSANRDYAQNFANEGMPGVAKAGVVILTCMDCRIDPLAILGLQVGDIKVLRNPGGQLDDNMMAALVLSAHLLNCDKIMIVPHTRCAMGSSSEEELHERVNASAGQDSTWLPFGAVADQQGSLRADVARVRSHPLIPDTVAVGGFIYDVDSGLLTQIV